MAQRLVLHTGTMKSGTSFIQNVLQHNTERLAEQGVLWPGGRWRRQISAVQDLADRGGPRQPELEPDGPWYSLADEINAWDGVAVVSMEFLGPRSRQKIRLIRKTFPDTDLQVVTTVRDLARCVPSMWQEAVQNGSTTRWEDFVAALRDEDADEGPAKWFWRHQGIADMAARWSRAVGRNHYTLVTVPQRGAPPGTLLERFGTAAGLDLTGYDVDVRANPSIGAATAMVLRDLNERLEADPLPKQRYHRYVKHELAKRTLAARSGQEPALGLDDPWIVERGRQEVARLRELDLRVVGDLDELLPAPVPGVSAADIDTETRLEVAVEALEHAVRAWSRPKRKKGKGAGKAGKAAKAGRAGRRGGAGGTASGTGA